MATRSTIAIETTEGFRAVYCHWDGYPEGVGETLKQNYKEEAQITALLDKGDISSLGETLEKSVFYADRGEENPAIVYKSEGDWLDWAANCNCEFIYLFKDGKWIGEAL